MKTEPTTLQELLDAKGLTHEQVADQLGVTRPAVTQWCGGQARPGGPAKRLLAQITGVSLATIEALFPSEGQKTKP